MKKSLLLTAALFLSAHAAHADEGMWTLYNLPQAVYEQMKTYGFTAPYDKIYKSDDAIMHSVVNFSGYCSGVVVSPDGLVLTNHHCGFEAIRSHSTVEHDYMLNGFYAKTFEEELPNKGMFVRFMVEQKDITPMLEQRGINSMNDTEREKLLTEVENELIKQTHEKDPQLELEVKPFYEGNKYYATTYREFRDLRLVFTIPKSMGKFGGETDNWMWPRLLRIPHLCRPEDQRSGRLLQGQRALPPEALDKDFNRRLQGRRLRNDHRLPRKHRTLPLKLRHTRDARRREHTESTDTRREAGRDDTPHACVGGSAHQV